MISFSQYQKFLSDLNNRNINSNCIEDLQHRVPAPASIYIKHDVECKLGLAVRMARIEAKEGHRATYYVQGDLIKLPGATEQLQEIAQLGHEVAYHYDVLDANDGDYEAAFQEFSEYRSIFRDAGFDFTTVCPHGNPTKERDGWKSNKDFFRSERIRLKFPKMLDIVIDFPKLFPEGRYLSDAGRTLRIIRNISGNDHSKLSAFEDGKAIKWEEICQLVNSSSGLVLSVHPHRFYSSAFSHSLQLASFSVLKFTYFKLRRFSTVRQIANKFYKLARRF